jgi:hypothetical protein
LIKSCKIHVAILAANVRDISRKASVLVPGQKLRSIPAQTFSHSPSSELSTSHPQSKVVETYPHKERTTNNRDDDKRPVRAAFYRRKGLHSEEAYQ